MSLESNSQCVTSKYFECKTVMDESLSDFQENKQNHKGPKINQKVTKPKHKKVIKRIKGQKDIRTVLKKNKNDLVSYAKEFDNVCKKSGVDVDSEQLQLAIALSKSLHTDNSDASSSQPLTAKGRLAKIRTTLQEYGFRVPTTKIGTNKKIKKNRNVYKLITTTEDERHQKITSKYAEVLLGCFHASKFDEKYSNNESNAPIFHFASNLPYEFMKDNNIFYVDNLLEKSTTKGYMLRDWAEIPGRPISPVLFDNSKMDFTELSCSQNELNAILSSSIRSAKDIVAAKRELNIKRQAYDLIENDTNNKEHERNNHDIEDCIVHNEKIQLGDNSKIKLKVKDIVGTNEIPIIGLESTSFVNNDQNRCGSPDLFEDDVSCHPLSSSIVTPIKSLSQGQKTKIFTESINYMDLTVCADNFCEKTLFTSQDKTKRKSDDFMDMTECAVSASQGIQNEEEIDLRKSPDEEPIKLETIILPNVIFSPKKDNSTKTSILNYQAYDSTLNNKAENFEQRPKVSISVNNENKIMEHILVTTHLANDTIDLTQNYKEEKKFSSTSQSKDSDSELECMDLTQSSKSSTYLDDLLEIKLNNAELHSNADDTIIMNEEEYISINDKKKSIIVCDDELDLTQDLNESAEEDSHEKKYQSFYDDFVHEHSDGKDNTQNNIDSNVQNKSEEIICIDAVQSPSNKSDISMSEESVIKTTSSSSLGKKDENISIDYDEICEYNNDIQNNKEENLNIEMHNSIKSQVSNDINQNDSFIDPASSQQSEVFDLTDKELNYSLHKSKHDNMLEDCYFDFGGISVMDNNNTGINAEKYLENKKSNTNETSTIRKSFIPLSKTPEAKSINYNEISNPNDFSPRKIKDVIKSSVSAGALLTPNNSEYIIKTNEVTPMIDYESMTTPQRNKELDKYGLRPFKRKRAIQILTHLYNQTHPVVESYLDSNQPSPLKKSKLDNEPSCSSPKNTVIYENSNTSPIEANRKSKSPRKCSGNLKKKNFPRNNSNSIGNIVSTYAISSEIPIIRSLNCNPEDWVFQKREKAKVHSCRVPLHIAFHNYVSSRRSLREAMLKYEPVNIDVIHKDLVSYGHRYDPKDLLRFLDKKCITVKTTDNNARNKR